jgi:hypothetical protein
MKRVMLDEKPSSMVMRKWLEGLQAAPHLWPMLEALQAYLSEGPAGQ